ncbi:SHOCT domain-containing protein [Weissella confusa]|uniref:SHOCT domain-containing protein n=1 Tax=Weissella fermenti TaxID=2987699 RepID=A0ABT6D3M0_9LACO|nr:MULTISPECIES: SHOCT domain-containing protein [Weissella]MBJ7688508.1 SHOCT domain-containing protein [Weissella confusa]MCW0927267.1 SHOCT domain-containing protein [Weissella sp. LMG 11983]MDF9299708.1 SHOCT domain-containing protein [Weissella sp. BK2]
MNPEVVRKLKEYKAMLDAGALTQEEFNQLKEKLLSDDSKASGTVQTASQPAPEAGKQEATPIQQGQGVKTSNQPVTSRRVDAKDSATKTGKKGGIIIGLVILLLVVLGVGAAHIHQQNEATQNKTEKQQAKAKSMSAKMSSMKEASKASSESVAKEKAESRKAASESSQAAANSETKVDVTSLSNQLDSIASDLGQTAERLNMSDYRGDTGYTDTGETLVPGKTGEGNGLYGVKYIWLFSNDDEAYLYYFADDGNAYVTDYPYTDDSVFTVTQNEQIEGAWQSAIQ